VVPTAAIDPAVAVLFLECTVHWFYFAKVIILINILKRNTLE
jgi:hypothetical protein